MASDKTFAGRDVIECKKTLGLLEQVTLYIAAVALASAILSPSLQNVLSQPFGVLEVMILVAVVGLGVLLGVGSYHKHMIRAQPEVLKRLRSQIVRLQEEKMITDGIRMELSELLLHFPASCHPYVKWILSQES